MPIITLKDTITITIDNVKSPPQATMHLSRDMPAPYVAMLLSQLIAQTMSTLIMQVTAGQAPPPLGEKPIGENPNGQT